MIRSARPEDSGAIAEIYNHYISNTVISFEEIPVSAEEINKRVTTILEAGLPWLVAEEDGEIFGYAYTSHWNKRAAYRNTVEISVYLSHLKKSQGIGTSLYKILFEQLNGHFHTVIGGITLPNPASIALHEKFGMQKVAHFREVGFKFGQWLDVGYWQIILNDPS